MVSRGYDVIRFACRMVTTGMIRYTIFHGEIKLASPIENVRHII